MITDLILSALFGALDAVVSLLPSWTPPSTITGTSLFGIVQTFSTVVPIGAIATALVAALALELLLRTWDLGVWIFHQFWGSS